MATKHTTNVVLFYKLTYIYKFNILIYGLCISKSLGIPILSYRYTVYSFEFAQSYFRPIEIWNWFAQSWIRPISNFRIQTLDYNSISPVLNSPLVKRVKRAKIKQGRNFPCIQYPFKFTFQISTLAILESLTSIHMFIAFIRGIIWKKRKRKQSQGGSKMKAGKVVQWMSLIYAQVQTIYNPYSEKKNFIEILRNSMLHIIIMPNIEVCKIMFSCLGGVLKISCEIIMFS